MKLVFTCIGAIAGLFAAVFVAHKSVHLARKHIKHYITIGKDAS